MSACQKEVYGLSVAEIKSQFYGAKRHGKIKSIREMNLFISTFC